MKVSNALKRLEKAAGNITIHKRDDGTPWLVTAKFGRRIVEFLANGRWSPDASITCIRVRRENDHDDSMTDYFAGSWMRNLTQAIRLAKRWMEEEAAHNA
jgi:hypothetical protein